MPRLRGAKQLVAGLATLVLVLLGSPPALAEAPTIQDPGSTAGAQSPAAETPVTQPTPAAQSAAPEPVAPGQAAAGASADAEAASGTPDPVSPAAPAADPAPAPVAPVEGAPEAPYLRWGAVSADGAVAPGATFRVEGPRDESAVGTDAEWAGAFSALVVDNVGQADYAGADLDPAAGSIVVKQLLDSADGATVHDVAAAQVFRVTTVSLGDGAPVEGAELKSLPVAGAVSDPIESLVTAPVQDPAGETTDPVTEAPGSEEPGAGETGSDGSDGAEQAKTQDPAGEASDAGFGVSLLAVGPDVPPSGAYVYWNAKDENGALVPGATFELRGPKSSNTNDSNNNAWTNGSALTVTDNTGQPGYTGADLDPDPGEFVVQRTGNAGSLSMSSRYRLQMTAAPSGYTLTDADWRAIPARSSNNSVPAPGAWVNNGYDFGDFALASPTPPWLVWTATDDAGAPLGGATFTLQSRGFLGWGTVREVADCTSGPCTGLDIDPAPGAFKVKYLVAPSTTPVEAGQRYRVSATTGPAGYVPVSTDYREIPSGGTWNDGAGPETHDFGAYPFIVPPPATIVVHTGGDRVGLTGLSNLAGVVLHLNTNTNSAPSGTRPDGVAGDGSGWARCVSDASGLCTFTVPDTGANGGANYDKRFWVVQQSVPGGWFMNQQLRTGGSGGAGSATNYQFLTGTQLRSGQTYTSGAQFMASGSNYTTSGGSWQQSRTNPSLVQGCGVDVALIMDLSGSVADALPQLKQAANSFTNALVGTPSRMSLFSFASTSPASGASANFPALTPVSTQAQADAFMAQYSGWTTGGSTNWDRGLSVPAAANTAANHYEIAVVITDGNPTTYAAGGSGSSTSFIHTENGIFSANLLKASGTRVIAFGVGDGATGAANALNLRAISGETAGSDYYQTTDYAAVGQTLRDLALGACAGQVTVTKMIVPNTAPAGSIAGAEVAGAGWTFTATDAGPGLTLPTPPAQTTSDDLTGTVAFPLGFAGGTTSAPLTITETQQTGHTIVPVNGHNAVCTNLNTGANVVPIGDPQNGFRIQAPSAETVNCTVYNRAPDQTATVEVTKNWIVQDAGGTVTGTYRLPGDEGRLPDGLSAQLMLNGPNGAGDSLQSWGVARTDYKSVDSVKIGETAVVDSAKLPGCTIVSKKLSKQNGQTVSHNLPVTSALQVGANEFEITNTVTCDQTLELKKVVDFGSAPASSWQLTATAPSGAAAGPQGNYTGAGSVKKSVTADAAYGLGESAAASLNTYTQNGDWQCTARVGNSDVPIALDGDGKIAVPLGKDVTCAVHNQTAKLTVFKDVEGGTQDPSQWTLTGAPASGVDGLTNASWPGSTSGSPSTGAQTVVEVRPGHSYELSESVAGGTSLAYFLTSVQKWNGTSWEDVGFAADGTLNVQVDAGEHDFYRFVNTPATGPTLPLTGGVSAEALWIGGGIVAVLAVGGGFLLQRRRMHRARMLL